MLGLFISTAHAQAGAPAQNPIMSFVPIILVFFVLYFFMIRPQKKKMEAELKFVSELKKGEEVYTKSGLIGVIYGLTEKFVTLEVDNGVKLRFLRSQINGSTKSLEPVKKVEKK